MILPKDRDPRFITICRGGTLTDLDHQLLALWAAACAEHVLHLFASGRCSTADRPSAHAGTVGSAIESERHKAISLPISGARRGEASDLHAIGLQHACEGWDRRVVTGSEEWPAYRRPFWLAVAERLVRAQIGQQTRRNKREGVEPRAGSAE